jgi:hypothetical protein
MLSFNTSPNNKSCVMELSDFRRIALSMPETEESNGIEYPNFRTGRKSFATIEDYGCDQTHTRSASNVRGDGS